MFYLFVNGYFLVPNGKQVKTPIAPQKKADSLSGTHLSFQTTQFTFPTTQSTFAIPNNQSSNHQINIKF